MVAAEGGGGESRLIEVPRQMEQADIQEEKSFNMLAVCDGIVPKVTEPHVTGGIHWPLSGESLPEGLGSLDFGYSKD